MKAATAVRTARQLAGLSTRALAREAKTSPAAIVWYESGEREPSISTLARLLQAAGYEMHLVMADERRRPDPSVCARRLHDVLELAERLPLKPRTRPLSFPILPR